MADPQDFLSDQVATWNADTTSGGVVTDLSGNSNDLTETTCTETTTSTGWGVAGQPVIVAGLSSRLDTPSETESTWKRLHDGTGASVWLVFKAGQTGIIFDTGIDSTAQCGARLRIDFERGRLNFECANGGGDGYLFDVLGGLWSWNGTIDPSIAHILVLTVSNGDAPDVHLWLDGQLVLAFSKGDREKPSPETRNWGSSDPTHTLRIMMGTAGISPSLLEFAAGGVTSSVMSFAERRTLEQWARRRYGIAIPSVRPVHLIWDGNSLLDNFWRANQVPELVTPTLRRLVRSSMRAVAGLTTPQMIDRVAKHLAPTLAEDAPLKVVCVTEIINDLTDPFSEGRTKEQCYASFVDYCQARREAGCIVVAAYLLPERFTDQATYDWFTAQFDANWTTFADAVVDATDDPIIGDWDAMVADYGGGSGPKTYRSDGVHFTLAGNEIWAPYWAAAITKVLLGRPIVAA